MERKNKKGQFTTEVRETKDKFFFMGFAVGMLVGLGILFALMLTSL